METEKKSAPFTDTLPRKKNHKEIRVAVCKAIDSFEDGKKITAEMIQDKASEFFPEIRQKHLETVMCYMRAYRRNECVCIDRRNSIYEKRAKEA